MAEQTINLPNSAAISADGNNGVRWIFTSNRPQIISAIAGPQPRYLANLDVIGSVVALQITNVPTSPPPDTVRADLSNAFESGGALVITVGAHSRTFTNRDTDDPYIITGNEAFANTLFGLSDRSGSLTLRTPDVTSRITLGDRSISQAYLGSSRISRIYLGTTEVLS